MKELFEHVRDSILHGMRAGMLVTPFNIDFDIGDWQHKPYWANNAIKHHLKQQWCSTLIILFIFDDTINNEGIQLFMDDNDFETHNRHIFLVYIIAIKKNNVSDETVKILKNRRLNINRFETRLEFGDYYLFVNDFVKNILKLHE